MAKLNNSSRIISPTLVLLLMGALHPLASSCQSVPTPARPPKMKSVTQVKKGLPKTIKPLEAAALINGEEIHEQVGSHPPLYLDVQGNALEGYYSIYYNRSTGGSDVVKQYPSIEDIGHFVKGRKEGEWVKEFGAAGEALNYTATYRNGLLDGPLIVYNADKSIHYRTVFQKGTGLWKAFYPSGRPKIEGAYQQGKAEGTWRTYDQKGQIVKEDFYRDGEVVSALK